MDATNHILLGLLRRALFGCPFVFDASDVDWPALRKEAQAQTVHLLIYDCLTAEERAAMPAECNMQWFSGAVQILKKNEQLSREQKNILSALNQAKIPCVVLKGSSCARNYPKPELRCAGDIDLLFSKDGLKQAESLLEKEGYSSSAEDHHCHIAMYRGGFIAELHFEPNGIPGGKLGRQLREFFSEAVTNAECIDGLPLMPVCSEAVVLLLHKLRHIVTGGLGLRQFCDWAEFVHKKLDSVAWAQLKPLLQSFGIMHFTKLATRLCVDYLGLPEETAPWCMDADPVAARMLLDDLLRTGNFGHKEERYGQRLFTDGGKGGRIASLFRVGVQTCRENWSPCKEHPILLAVAPFVLAGRYCRQRCAGKRPPLKIRSVFLAAGQRQELYRELRPFWNEEDEV